MFLFVLAIAPTIAIMLYIYSRDRYDKEPKWFLFKCFCFGSLTIIPAIICEQLVAIDVKNTKDLVFLLLYALLGIALIEEGWKYFVLRLLVKKCKFFNQMYDAIVYSVFVSLGFATIENILYVLALGNKAAIGRAITAVPGHAIFGITMGFYLGMATFTGNEHKKKTYMTLSFVMPIVLHGIYDFLLISKHPILIVAFIPFMIYLYMNGIKKTKTLCKMDNYNRRLEEQRMIQELNDNSYDSYIGHQEPPRSPFGQYDPYHHQNPNGTPYTNYQQVNYDYLHHPNGLQDKNK